MKTTIIYRIEPEDPSLKYIFEALHRVPSFVPDESEGKALARLKDGEIFPGDPIEIVGALQRAGQIAELSSLRHQEPLAASIRQAGENCYSSAYEFAAWFAMAKGASK